MDPFRGNEKQADFLKSKTLKRLNANYVQKVASDNSLSLSR